MKLQHFPIGTRFEYEGEIFVKTGPLTASSEKSGQRVIPRYALLKPLDGNPPAASTGPNKLDEAVVIAAFDEFYGCCSRLLDQSAGPDLENARQQFLKAIKR